MALDIGPNEGENVAFTHHCHLIKSSTSTQPTLDGLAHDDTGNCDVVGPSCNATARGNCNDGKRFVRCHRDSEGYEIPCFGTNVWSAANTSVAPSV